MGKVKQAIDECSLSGGALTEQRLCDIFEGFSNEMREQFQQATNRNGNAQANVGERIETGQGYQWHSYRGSFHQVPEDWRFLGLVFLICGINGGLETQFVEFLP